jgi:peptide-methionine (R)-S-oxide reductase
MRREDFLRSLLGLAAAPLVGCSGTTGPEDDNGESRRGVVELFKTNAEWRALLSDPEYYILFEGGTEVPYSSPLDAFYDPGTYVCRACFLPLFLSETKYDSMTGWPSFWDPIGGALAFRDDRGELEYHCRRCGGHQGHVFDDGPQPTGKRYCNNGLSLRFVAEGQTLPDLRS